MRKIFLLFCSVYLVINFALPTSTASAFSLFPKKVCEAGNTDCIKNPNKACSPNDKTCANLCAGEGVKSSVCQAPAEGNPVANLIGAAANLLALIAGLVAVVMIIIAGFQLVTSGGNSEQLTKARGRILGAIIGLIIIALAWTIIRLVTDNILV